AGEGAAGDLDADAVAPLEAVRGRPQPHLRHGGLVGAGEAGQAVADVGGAAVGVDVTETDEDVGVGQAGAEEDFGADVTDDLDVLVQHGGRVGEDVGAGFEGGVV